MCQLSLLAFAEYTERLFFGVLKNSENNNNSILFELIRMSNFIDANSIQTDTADAIMPDDDFFFHSISFDMVHIPQPFLGK